MRHDNVKQTDSFRKMLGSAIMVVGATAVLLGAIWILKPAPAISVGTEATASALSPAAKRRPVPTVAEESTPFTGSSALKLTAPDHKSIPDEVQQDGMDAARFESIKKLAQESPQSALPVLIEEYNRGEAGKAFWAEAIGFIYQDQLNKSTEALTWMETAILLHTQDKNLPEALIQLYAKTDEIERAAEFLQRMEEGSVKNIFRAKLLYMGQNYKESQALLRTIPEADLDEASLRLLERAEKGEAS